MGTPALQSQQPPFFFNPSELRNAATRFASLCHDFNSHFIVGNRSVTEPAKCYLSGLVMKAPRKNMERMGEYVVNCNYEVTQHFLSESPWCYRGLTNHVAKEVDSAIGGPESVFDIDESGLTKKGDKSVGVSRQYNGRLGKVDNCQVAVFGALTNGQRVSLVDTRLYLPQDWIDSPSRCQCAGIPDHERIFRTKPQLGLEIIDTALKNGLRFGCVSFDALYGNTPYFLDGLDLRQLRYVGALHKDQIVYTEDPSPYLPHRKGNCGPKHTLYKSKKNGVRVDTLNETMTRPWNLITIREGAKGYVGLEARRQRVWLWQAGVKNVREQWLIILRDPFTQELKYYISNADKKVSLTWLVKKAACRFFIERTFQDAKTSVGMADYQVRVWTGWNHHMAMVMLALLFMLKERIRNEHTVSLLSCQDIVEILNIYLHRADRTEEAIFQQMEQRHIKRQKAIEQEYKKQAARCKSRGINLTM